MGRNEEQTCRVRRKARYDAADVNGKLIIRLRDISHTMRRLYEGRGSQKQILIRLWEDGPVTQRALTERLGIQPGSASEVIAKLENAGLITRIPSETDRRTADVILTESGKATAREAAEQRRRRHEEMFSCLTGEEKTALLALLDKVHADWEQRYQDTGERERGGDAGRPRGPHGHHGHHAAADRSEGSV
ncbi:MAG: MarR family winged helix-turn-helix transcriptional regulator [Oscillospiraceae bacterium]